MSVGTDRSAILGTPSTGACRQAQRDTPGSQPIAHAYVRAAFSLVDRCPQDFFAGVATPDAWCSLAALVHTRSFTHARASGACKPRFGVGLWISWVIESAVCCVWQVWYASGVMPPAGTYTYWCVCSAPGLSGKLCFLPTTL